MCRIALQNIYRRRYKKTPDGNQTFAELSIKMAVEVQALVVL